MNNITEIAIKKAQQSSSKYRISAIALDKNGKVLSTGVNRPRFNRGGGGLHAEMAALEKAGPRITSMIICRIGNSGDILQIEPCKSCRRVLEKKKIKIYTINP